ncbi:P-loop containing nucleoside triphosphate hydrolase protein [Lipomyces starkeyi]
MTGLERMIVHIVSREVEVIFIQYLAYGLWQGTSDLTYTIHKTRNDIITSYSQYVFAGPNGRWHAESLRRVIRKLTGESETLLSSMNAQSLRQALVALLDHHVGHLNAFQNTELNYVEDVQSGHTSHIATTYYAVGTGANRNDVHEFMNVSDRWISFLGLTTSTSVVDSITGAFNNTQVGQQFLNNPELNGQAVQDITIRQTIQMIPDRSEQSLPALSAATHILLRKLRGEGASFRSVYQAAAIQSVLSYPAQSFMVILPTGGGKSDIIFITALKERDNRRVTVTVVPFVALHLDIIRRGEELGLEILSWDSSITIDRIRSTDILLVTLEHVDSGLFRDIFTQLLVDLDGRPRIARIIFDEADTVLIQFGFRGAYSALPTLTSLNIPCILLSATVPPTQSDAIRLAYGQRDIQTIRAPSTTRHNISYNIVIDADPTSKLDEYILSFFQNRGCSDKSLVFCMSIYDVETLSGDYRSHYPGIGEYHGQMTDTQKKDTMDKWIRGELNFLFVTGTFGQGIDVRSIRLVIHYRGFWQLIEFAQESGRAGRDGQPARSIVIVSPNWKPNPEKVKFESISRIMTYGSVCRRYASAL